MPEWFNKLGRPADSPDVADYRAIRAAPKIWFSKITAHPGAKPFDITKAGRKLGLSTDAGPIIFDGESEMAVLTDYFLFDFRPKQQSVAESCVFAPGELAPLEAEFHRANLASRTSLFEVTHVHDHEPRILLRDRLTPTPSELWLTDLSLSDTFRRFGGRLLLFTRVVSLHGLHITGGFSFVFDPKHESALVEGYRRDMWSVPEPLRTRRRTGYFLALNRKYGLPQDYADVVPSSEAGDAT